MATQDSGWTVETLKEYVEAIFAEHSKALGVALAEVNAAILAAAASAEKRHEAGLTLTATQSRNIQDQLNVLNELKANERAQLERIEALRRETAALRDANDKAIVKSESATDKRFESVNEFRAQLADQAGQFMPRNESEQLHHRTAERLEEINRRLNLTEGRSRGQAALFGALLGVSTIVIAIIVVIVNILTSA